MADIDTPPARDGISFGPFALFPGERLLTLDDAPVEIGGRSLDLLIVLTEQPGRVLSKRDLLKRVWSDVVVEDGSLRFHMAGLRKLLGDGKDGARYIATQVGVGYAFVAKVERHGPAAPLAAATVPVEPVASPLNLPPRLPLLIGRERDIDLLRQRMAQTPLFTIVGPGGVGKTSLAVEMGHLLAESFQQQVAFIDFSMLENPELVPGMLAGGMGLAVQGADPLAAILGHLRTGPFLLILDNCEHLIEQIALLAERLIEAAPQLRILATSREPLRVRGEHIHRLDALTCPQDDPALSTAEILAAPAVQLLRDRACAADSTLVIDDEAARLMAIICRRLDGMALALELAAVRVATHGLHAAARQLEERFSLGWAGRRTALPRQQTLQAMLDWSYDLLTPDQRIVLERLCVFVGPFSVDAALEVVADATLGSDAVVSALDELVAKSLIAPDRMRGAGSYRLLEMTRAYARQKLQTRGDEAVNAAARRHAAYFLAELEAIAAQDEDVLQDPRPLRQQLGNIRSALDWSFGPEGNNRIGVRLAAASTAIFLNLSHYVECQGWCARALEAIEDNQRGTALEMELQGALGLALMFSRGSTRPAGQALSRALEVATALDDPWGQLRMLGRLHIYHERIGDCAITMQHALRAVSIAESMEEAEAIGVARSLSGISHYLAGDQRQAKRDLELSLAVCPVLSRNRMLYYGFDHRNRSTIALARSLWLGGYAQRAIAMSQQAVELATRLDQPVTLCIALIWDYALQGWRDDLDGAEEALTRFAACAQTNALGPYMVAAEGFRGDLAIRRGQRDYGGGSAIEAVEQSLARLRAARYELLTTNFSIAQARGLLLEERWREAEALVDTTIARCNAIGEGFAMPELLGLKARIAQASGQNPIPFLEEALALAQQQGAEAWVLRNAIALATGLAGQGRVDEAARQLQAALASLSAAPDTVELSRAQDLMASFNATQAPG